MSSERAEMPDGERIKEVEQNGYKYLGILEYKKIKENEMKENFWRKYLRRIKLIMKSKLNDRNKTMAVSLIRYGAGIMKWTNSELDEIYRKIRKVMTINRELHPRSGVDWFYVSRIEGLIGFKMCVKVEKNSLGW